MRTEDNLRHFNPETQHAPVIETPLLFLGREPGYVITVENGEFEGHLLGRENKIIFHETNQKIKEGEYEVIQLEVEWIRIRSRDELGKRAIGSLRVELITIIQNRYHEKFKYAFLNPEDPQQ